MDVSQIKWFKIKIKNGSTRLYLLIIIDFIINDKT